MRLLFIPVYTNKNLNGCTSYNTGKKFVEQAISNDDVFVHWYLPEINEDRRWHYRGEKSPMENHPKVHAHRADMYEEQYVEIGFVPQDLYDTYCQHCGKHHIDAVLTERPASAWYVHKLLQHPFIKERANGDGYTGKASSLPIFIRDPFVKSKDIHGVSTAEEIAQTMGYLCSYNIFFSQYDLDLAVSVAKKYLNFAQVKRMIDNSIVVPPGTDTEELDKLSEGVELRDRFTLLIAERLKSGAMMDSLDAGDYIFKRGYPIDIVVSSQAPFNGFTLNNYPTLFEHAECYPSNPREKFIPLAKSCHATITMPSTASYPQGLMERLYLGNVAVLPKYKWVDSVLPDYPFRVGRNVTEMVAVIQWIMENYEEAKRKVEPYRRMIKEKYDSKVCNQKMVDFIREKTEKHKATSPAQGGYLDVLKDLDKDRITEKELLKFMKDNTRIGVVFNNPKKTIAFTNTKSALFRAMEEIGYKDTCEGLEPIFVREKENFNE